MPELPEVETVRRGLLPYLEGATLRDVTIHRPNLRYPFPDHFSDRLNGASVIKLERRAKYLLAWLDTQSVWITHLGMTGRFHIEGAQALSETRETAKYYHATKHNDKHLHFQCTATKLSNRLATGQKDDSQAVRIDYFDPRRFGFMLLITPDELYAAKWYRELGIEPLSDELTTAHLMAMAKDRNVNLKTLLMGQGGPRGGIAGLGNIYVCEALWRARLSPDHKAAKLKTTEAEALVDGIRTVLEEAVAAGGSSISDFAAASGELGYFQHRFCVYDRKGQPCARQDGGLIERNVHQGRSSFFCPVCQK